MSALVTNEQVAVEIGLTHSAVSRLRSGYRLPSFETMVEIELAYDWPISEQAKARKDQVYAAEFEKRLARKHGKAA